MTAETKYCKAGDHYPPLSAFGTDKTKHDKLTVYCKACRNRLAKKYYVPRERATNDKRSETSDPPFDPIYTGFVTRPGFRNERVRLETNE